MADLTAKNRVFYTYRMPFGNITIAANDSHVLQVALGSVQLDGANEANSITNDCANQLVEYLAGKRSVFDVPFKYDGTEFQNHVWDAICEIPYSHVRTNMEIAEAIGQPNSFRKVGAAVRQNPLPILVPAHRVVSSNGYVSQNDERGRLRAAFRDLESRFG